MNDDDNKVREGKMQEPTRRVLMWAVQEVRQVTRWVEKKRRVKLWFDGLTARKNNMPAARPVWGLACILGLGELQT